jgi:hypothetical protein
MYFIVYVYKVRSINLIILFHLYFFARITFNINYTHSYSTIIFSFFQFVRRPYISIEYLHIDVAFYFNIDIPHDKPIKLNVSDI